MEIIRSILSCVLLGTFLLLSHYPSITISQYLPRRLLATSGTIQQYLEPHNIERTKLGLPPLKWSQKLAKFAKSWAKQRQRNCELIHSNSNYGENLFWGSGPDWKPSDAVNVWAEERSYYNYKKNDCVGNKDCLHYTQMIWRQSMKVGCAKVVCSGGDTFITCNYDPHGNVIGQKPF